MPWEAAVTLGSGGEARGCLGEQETRSAFVSRLLQNCPWEGDSVETRAEPRQREISPGPIALSRRRGPLPMSFPFGGDSPLLTGVSHLSLSRTGGVCVQTPRALVH